MANEDKKAQDKAAVATAIASMPDADRVLAEKIHTIVTTNAPNLLPRTWYGMPAYAQDTGKIVCFFRPAVKFGERYATFGFNDVAKLDDGNMWGHDFAIAKLGDAEERKVAELVRKAI